MMEIKRGTHVIDAAGRPLGRLATEVATLLMGKNKPSYVPNVDAGDFVQVTNLKAIKFTGKKLDQKQYKWSAGYPGGLKTKSIRVVFEKNPGEVLRRAVINMLPRNTFRTARMKRLTGKE